MFRLTVAIWLTAALASTAFAQIVNVLPYADESDRGFAGRAQGGIDFREGNTEIVLFRASVSGAYRTERDLYLLIGNGEIGSKSGDRFAANAFGHGRYRRALSERVKVEAFAQGASDEFRRLSLRALAGGGVRLEWKSETTTLALATAYMAEHERLRVGKEPDSGEETSGFRSSSYIAFQWEPDERFSMSQTTFIQPLLSDFEDVRVLHEATVSLNVSTKVVVPISLTVTHDSRPPSGVDGTDVRLRSSVGVRF